MTFDDMPLYEAIHDVHCELENPGSDRWIVGPESPLVSMIIARLEPPIPWTRSEIINAWSTYRKSANGKADLTIKVARLYGRKCFYANRGLGDCSLIVSVDRIVPESRGGEYRLENCVIACSAHNSRRGDRSIEEFLNDIKPCD